MQAIRLFLIAAVMALTACAATPTQRSTGEQIDDAAITTQVKAKFASSPTVDAMDIKVETYKGVVQLSGFADSQTQIDQAVGIARQVDGVSQVRNDIRLKTG